MAKVLVVEDDLRLAEMIETALTAQHFSVEVTSDGANGLERLLASFFDLAVIDWGLPGLNGIDLCKEYRNRRGQTPIIMLTGRNTIVDKEQGFYSGVDDYLTKPFHMKELSMRINALLQRARRRDDDVLKSGNLVLNPVAFTATKNGVDLALVPKEFALLEFLMRHPGEFFTAEALLRHVWASDSETTEEALRTCVKRLRRKIDDGAEDSLIESTPRVGYRLRPHPSNPLDKKLS